MPSGIDTMSLFLSSSQLEGIEDKLIYQLRKEVNPDNIEVEHNIALIAVVGRGMRKTRGTAGRIFSALAHKRINVKMIDQGSSELNIIIGVSESDFNEALSGIYDMFVKSVLAKD